MLRRPSDLVADCYWRAVAAAQRASQSNKPEDRAFWLRCEQRWLSLANHQANAERLDEFVLSREAITSYRVRRADDNLWEWSVLGSQPDIVFAGVAENMVAARVEAFQFIADLADDSLN